MGPTPFALLGLSFEFRIDNHISDLKIVDLITSGASPLEPNFFGLDGERGF